MEIDKTLALAAPPERVWALLLDPQAMAACVPGMESVQVISDTEYAAVMKVKVSFISARFKLRTRIVESDMPRYLRAEGTGEDSSVASSLKQVSEMWLDPVADGGTALRLKVQVDVLGRIGSFGLAAMKTKSDRLWDEFGVNLAALLAQPADTPAAEAIPAGAVEPAVADMTGAAVAPAPATTTSPPQGLAPGAMQAPPRTPTVAFPRSLPPVVHPGLWQRMFGRTAEPIRVELRRGNTHLVVSFPVEAAAEGMAWLRTLTGPDPS